ncbi:ATP-dependent DNA helicase RecG [Cellulomonas sp. JH27-2]|uniref:ATP-dependent DNA helicase RecG n=1 Tax=Cellulomonas sp. JH27-2 TaxID=2774139 RepID=UPI00178526A8|nr:ATP-dependent DNA helicase RecG [Cellulomonas sp. JH27-2]
MAVPRDVGYEDRVEHASALDAPVGSLAPRIGPSFEALGLRTAGDVARYYPRRYADPSTLTDIAGLVVGETVSVVAEVRRSGIKHARGTGDPRVEAEITDGRRSLRLTFFVKREYVAKKMAEEMHPGRRGLFTGKVSVFRDQAQLTNPQVSWFDGDDETEERSQVEVGWPTPIYSATAKLPSDKIRGVARLVVEPLRDDEVDDPVPAQVRERRGLGSLRQALYDVHVPRTEQDWRSARHRLRYEEAFVLQAELARRRARAAAEPATARPATSGGLLDAFDARLPFALTDGQRRVGAELADELARSVPMQRLLQGEVGSGKTVVALRAMLQVVDAGGQAALLAPTEVLAAQHARSLRRLLGDLAEGGMLGGAEIGTRVALLTGSLAASARREALLDAAGGAAGIVVGTHALLSANVQFADLGLVVVDEQHKFGVEQRDTLRAKAATAPHLLVMTATPIPRTVAMTVFGDLETSVLDEVPAGRSGVVTHVVPAGKPAWVARTWTRVREEVAAGGRAYVVCARIEGDDGDGADLVAAQPATLGDDGAAARRPLRAVVEVADELRALPDLAGIGVGVLHGRLAAEDKERALADFASGVTPVLVSTTVVEVGVDVPEATVMVILDADRFGVSQLHQLRGRIGRGSAPGVCLLVSGALPGTPADDRVNHVAATHDGFELAAFDLEQRGEGDVLGASQWGSASSLRLLRVTRDGTLIEQARADARELVEQDVELTAWPALRAAIDARLTDEAEEFLDRT